MPALFHFSRKQIIVFLLSLCMFSTGASGLVNEYILATMSSYILGNSIEQFSLVIAAMMLMMGLSGWVQQFIQDAMLSRYFIQLEMAMALLGAYAPIAIYSAFALFDNHFILIHYFFILSIGFLIGFEIPLVMRLVQQYGYTLKHNLKIVYAMDYLGGFVGALIWVNYLLHHFPLTEISFIVSSFNFSIALITILVIYYPYYRQYYRILLMVIAVVLLLIWGYQHNRDWNLYMEQKFYDDPIVTRLTTRYQHLVITHNHKTDDLRLYINGHTQFSSLDEARYHEMLVHPAMLLNARHHSVLILGGGDGLALREVLKYPRVQQVTLVDLDPQMVQLARTQADLRQLNRNAFADARVHTQFPLTTEPIINREVKSLYGYTDRRKTQQTQWIAQVDVLHLDAAKFVHAIKQRWDVIIIDFPDPSSIALNKLYSREFYGALRRLLYHDSLLVIQATSPYHANKVYNSILQTLQSVGFTVLPYHQNVPSFGEWGFVLGWRGNTTKQQMRQKLEQQTRIPVSTRYVTPQLILAATVFGKHEIMQKQVCINTLMHPCLLDLYLHESWLSE